MSKGGSNRDWGYASYDVDRYDDDSDSNLQNNSSDYNNGNEPDYSRRESNSSPNPSIGDVQNNGGCYLTSACMRCFQENFDDNCYELRVLRWFRDNFVSKEDIEHYYEIAPIIVESINKEEKSDIIYDYIYDNIVDYCIEQIEQGNYDAAYSRYKNSIIALEEQFAKPILQRQFVKTLKKLEYNKTEHFTKV